jgi:hypothetical protein
MRILKNRDFWIGVGVGVVVMPMILGKIAPNVKAKLPS